MLRDHRRVLWYAFGLLAALAVVFVAVGRRAPEAAPATTVAFVGSWDRAVTGAMDDIRTPGITFVASVLNLLGRGIVTIPLRFAVALWLAARTRWRALAAWLLTWGAAELLLTLAKWYFHRGRPPAPLVTTVGFSFPSGHAVAGTAIAVALVLVLFPAGPARRRWEAAAIAFAFVMAFSRVYLRAHWMSDVVAGVLLGTAVALGAAALVTELHHHVIRRGWSRGAEVEGSLPQPDTGTD